MVISKTPFRISFFGGGTDFPAWYNKEGREGLVLSATINKYSYITCRKISDFFDQHKLVYHEIEYVPKNKIDEIRHPSIREVFRFLNIKESLFINYDTDLPARSGLGSSSAFTVGLLNALYKLSGNNEVEKYKGVLANQAIYIEQNLIGENVGSQDQTAVSHGGLNYYSFKKDGIRVIKPKFSTELIEYLENSLMLFFTGYTRIADQIEKDKINNIEINESKYEEIYRLTKEIFTNGLTVEFFPNYLNDLWKIKKDLSKKVSNKLIDEIYDTALKNGAAGGKLLGSGGGGFFLFFVDGKNNKVRVREALKDLKEVPFKFENLGSHVIFNNGES